MTIINSNRDLKSGFYTVRIRMTTQDGVTDYGNGWFEVSNFIFFAYSTSFDNGLGRPINFTLNTFDSSFNKKNVSVSLKRIISMGDREMMAPPTVYNETNIDVGHINGTGYYEYSAGINKGGNFEFVFEANDGNSTEAGRAWVNLRSFVTWLDTNNVYEFSTTGLLNATVVASRDNIMGGSSGSSINITNVTVEKVMQEGMYMTSYRSKSEMASITTTEKVSGVNNRINISVNTSGWGQGGYVMKLKVTDNQSNEVYTEFWFRMALAGVYMPEMNFVSVNAGTYFTNTTSFNVSTDVTSVKNTFAGQSLGNVTAGKVGGIIVNGITNDAVKILQSSNENQIFEEWNKSQNPQFAMVVVDTVMRTVYIEYRNATDGSETQYYNLSNNVKTQVFNASAGDTFTDYTGRRWRITSITDDGTVSLEGVNTLKNGLILDNTVMSGSKSGKFLLGTMYDDQWRNIDLDGDNDYFNDRYYILMIDNTTSGVYDKVYVSNGTNFSNGRYIDASAGTAVGFGGKPTYLISNKYQSGTYQLQFTTYRQGWKGMNLGTFANGTVVKIPFLVSNPGGSALSNKLVAIDSLIDESKDVTALTGVNAITDANGLAIISLNTSQVFIPTGSWMIKYNATIGNSYAVPDDEMLWELPRFELRNFVVSGALGIPGNINLIKLNDSDTTDRIPGNNMLISYGDEIDFMRGIGFWWNYHNERYQLEYPFNDWWYNTTGTGFFNYSTDNGIIMNPGNGTRINSSNAKNVVTYNVTTIKNSGELINITIGSNDIYNMWRFNVTAIQGTTSTTIKMSYKGWPWTWPDPQQPWNQPQIQPFNNGSNWWIGGLDFQVININETANRVQLRLNQPVLIAGIDALSILTDDNDANGEAKKMRGSVNNVTFNGHNYLIYGYEDVANTSGDLINGGGGRRIETMDRVLVVNQTSLISRIYRIGENIPDLNNYYVAGAPEWGGRIFLLNGSVTNVFPIPEWTSDSPIFYTGRFSDQDIGLDIPTMGVGGPDTPAGVITSDRRYSILMFDRLANGVNFPTEAIYDDDSDLTQLNSWSGSQEVFYDMYNNESGYRDAISQQMGGGPGMGMNITYINMSEKFAWDVGTGNMQTWPMAIPTINISDSSVTGTAKTFAPKSDLNRSDNITIYVIAKDFSGVRINGVAQLTKIKMSFGGNITNGFFDTLPMTFTMAPPINVTLVDGEGLITLTPAQLPDELKSGGPYDFDFAELTAVVQITESGTGRVETLKNNFFVMAKDKMRMGGPMEGGKTSGGVGGGSGGSGGGGSIT